MDRNGKITWDEMVYGAGGAVPAELSDAEADAKKSPLRPRGPRRQNNHGVTELKQLYDAMDRDHDGGVTIKEWIEALVSLADHLRTFFGGTNLADLASKFNVLDSDRSGTLSWEEVLNAAGANMQNDEQGEKRGKKRKPRGHNRRTRK